MIGKYHAAHPIAVLAPVLILGVPVFDTLFVDLQLHPRPLLRHQARFEVGGEAGHARLQGNERHDSVSRTRRIGEEQAQAHDLPRGLDSLDR